MDPFSPLVAEVLEIAAEVLVDVTRPRIAVLGDLPAEQIADALRTHHPAARLVVVPSGAPESAAHVTLAVENPYALVVDATLAAGPAQVDWFRRAFFHLRGGGSYLVCRPATAAAADPSPADPSPVELCDVDPFRDVVTMLALAPDRAANASEPEPVKDLAWIGTAVAGTEERAGVLVVRIRQRYLAKLHDEELERLLPHRRPGSGSPWPGGHQSHDRPPGQLRRQLLTARPGALRRPVPLHPVRCAADVPAPVDAPLCARSQLLVNRGLLLPDSFRHHQARRLMNNHLFDTAKLFARQRHNLSDPEEPPGAYFYFDSEWPGHFGHTVTEQLSRLWALDRARAHDPGLKLLTTLPPKRGGQLQDWELALLAAFDLGRDDVVVFDRAARPETLYAASPMFTLPEYVSLSDHPRYQSGFVHPELLAVWDRVADSLLAQATVTDTPQLLFCSRRPDLNGPVATWRRWSSCSRRRASPWCTRKTIRCRTRWRCSTGRPSSPGWPAADMSRWRSAAPPSWR